MTEFDRVRHRDYGAQKPRADAQDSGKAKIEKTRAVPEQAAPARRRWDGQRTRSDAPQPKGRAREGRTVLEVRADEARQKAGEAVRPKRRSAEERSRIEQAARARRSPKDRTKKAESETAARRREHLAQRTGWYRGLSPGSRQRVFRAAEGLSPKAVEQLEASLRGLPEREIGRAAETFASLRPMVREAVLVARELRSEDRTVDAGRAEAIFEKLPAVRMVADQVTQDMREFVAAATGLDPRTFEIIPLKEGGAKGQSGAAVHFVRRGRETIAVVKSIFRAAPGQGNRGLSGLAEAGMELSSTEALYREGIPAPQLFGLGSGRYADGRTSALIIQSAAPGYDFFDHLKWISRAPDDAVRRRRVATSREGFEDLYKVAARLHTRPARETPSKAYIDAVVHELEVKRDRVLELIRAGEVHGLDANMIRDYTDWLIEKYRSQPGRGGMVHGDLHPGNAFWHPESRVTLIDTSSLHLSLDSKGEGAGSPAQDLTNLDSYLHFQAEQWGLRLDEIADLRGAARAYTEAGGAREHGSAPLFWNASHLFSQLHTRNPAQRERVRDSLLGDIKKHIGDRRR